jgi:hypothetical protein
MNDDLDRNPALIKSLGKTIKNSFWREVKGRKVFLISSPPLLSHHERSGKLMNFPASFNENLTYAINIFSASSQPTFS